MTAENNGSPNLKRSNASRVWQRIYRLLASVKLALVLLILILVCCLAGVTILRGARSWTLIFDTLWFNSLLILLVVNVAFCFFGRIWGRRLTLVSLGMILFHLSFVAMLGGIVYNSLFYFRGVIRLTEGETLPSGDPASYDQVEYGRFFDFEQLRGETTLIKMHKGYTVDGQDKHVAYEVAVGEGPSRKRGIIYITHQLDHGSFSYFRDKEGYSLLILLYDKRGRELYGAHIPLQSYPLNEDTYLYTTGTKEGPGGFLFPVNPAEPLFGLQATYRPLSLQGLERQGEVTFATWPLHEEESRVDGDHRDEGKTLIGEKVRIGEYYLSVGEVRYWVGMSVRYEPGKRVVLVSLWVGLIGMIITFIGRMSREQTRKSMVSNQPSTISDRKVEFDHLTVNRASNKDG